MMKGYLTIFLSLSLSLLVGFVLLLTGGALRNGEKVRFESAVDVSMNATLAEYHVGLLEKYDLFYIDTSYLGSEPAKENLESRLSYYLDKNTDMPWGRLVIEEVEIEMLETAVAAGGASMQNQAVTYILNYGEPVDRQHPILHQMEEIRRLEAQDPMAGWNALMEQLAVMELPKVQNEEGIWEEVPLSNPADVIYGMAGSDLLYLAEIDLRTAGAVSVRPEDYISHRQIQNKESMGREYLRDEGAFLAYLFEKMGCFRHSADSMLLNYQLEYVACGRNSDFENAKAVGERLFRWRFADNLSCALADGNLRGQADAAASALQAVQLQETFKEPVVQSILYACAFLESVNDVRVLYQGGEVPLRKNSHNMSVGHVLNGSRYQINTGDGLTYKEYLAGMLLLLEEETLNLRVMDIMEMEMRMLDENPYFAMDWCVERYDAKISVINNFGDKWSISRRYGFY